MVLSPMPAWLCMLSYRKKKVSYMSGFVFGLHWSSLIFLLVTLYILLGESWHYSGYPAWGFVLIMLVYTTIASHRVYAGTGWIKSFFKTFLVLFSYSLIVLVVLATLFGLLLYSQKQIIANIVNPMWWLLWYAFCETMFLVYNNWREFIEFTSIVTARGIGTYSDILLIIGKRINVPTWFFLHKY